MDCDAPKTTPNSDSPRVDRRTFLEIVAALGGAGWLSTLVGCVNDARQKRTAASIGAASTAGKARVLTPGEWATLEAALDAMIPSGPGSPGSRDVFAIAYLDAALADRDTDPSDVLLARAGATWLDEAARRAGARDLPDAPSNARETAMRDVALRSRGPEWMLLVLMFGLEALLGDPAHGGNPGEIGWRWLDHVPGQPRPSMKAVEGPR